MSGILKIVVVMVLLLPSTLCLAAHRESQSDNIKFIVPTLDTCLKTIQCNRDAIKTLEFILKSDDTLKKAIGSDKYEDYLSQVTKKSLDTMVCHSDLIRTLECIGNHSNTPENLASLFVKRYLDRALYNEDVLKVLEYFINNNIPLTFGSPEPSAQTTILSFWRKNLDGRATQGAALPEQTTKVPTCVPLEEPIESPSETPASKIRCSSCQREM